MDINNTPDDKIELLEDIIEDYFTGLDPDDRAQISSVIEREFTQYGFQTLIMTNGHDELLTKLGTDENESIVEIAKDVLFNYAFQYNRYFGKDFTVAELVSPILQARKAMLCIADKEDVDAGRYIDPDKISYIGLIFIYIVETLSSAYNESTGDGKSATDNGDA